MILGKIWHSARIIKSKLRGIVFKGFFKKTGKNLRIENNVTIIHYSNIELGNNILLNKSMWLIGGCGIEIGNDVLFAPNVMLISETHNYNDITRPISLQGGNGDKIIIKDGSWIGANAVIMPGVTIGRNSVIGAGSIVTKNIPDYCIAAGVPARIIKYMAEKNI